MHRTAGKTIDQRFAVIVMPDAQGSGFILMSRAASHPAIGARLAHLVETGQKVVDVGHLLTSSFSKKPGRAIRANRIERHSCRIRPGHFGALAGNDWRGTIAAIGWDVDFDAVPVPATCAAIFGWSSVAPGYA
ncbi:MAG: hypothetical protein IPL05_09725 [Betaproteobacteria bacterium]|nr:hypothetical protein [Betaproteobacteria bacterium]